MSLSKPTLRIMTFGLVTVLLFQITFVLLHAAECSSVVCQMLNAILLCVIVLNVVAPNNNPFLL